MCQAINGRLSINIKISLIDENVFRFPNLNEKEKELFAVFLRFDLIVSAKCDYKGRKKREDEKKNLWTKIRTHRLLPNAFK